MALPKLIAIQPLHAPVRAAITVPGSKSITNRALICAAVSRGQTTLQGALWSEDTEVMVGALKTLGFDVLVQPDPSEPANRTLHINGQGGEVPSGGNAEQPLDLFVGNAGTAARFLSALVCLGRGVYRLTGVPRMHERPQAALFSALRQLGYRIDATNDRLPAVIHGGGPRAGSCEVSIAQSSQFASALLLCATAGGWDVRVCGENSDESPYVRMTEELLQVFPCNGGSFAIEPDASSGSYFWGAAQLLIGSPDPWQARTTPPSTIANRDAGIEVTGWPTSGWQIDAVFPKLLCPQWQQAFGRFTMPPAREISRSSVLGDSIMTAIVLAPFWAEPTSFTELGRLRVQECERVQALRTELTRCGAQVRESGDTLTVLPSGLHGAKIETYNDHRMAMCFAMLGLRVPGIQILDPACVRKTFPNFFQKLAAPPPQGLGCEILDPKTRRKLAPDELAANG